MSDASILLSGILFVLIPTVMFGGYALLRFLTRRDPGYLENPLRRAFFVAGHAHAGILIILSLISLQLVDQADLSDGWKTLVRNTIPSAAVLMSAGFFLSVASPKATQPNRLIGLVYVGASSLLVGSVTLGIGLIRAV
jgi:hypothetical protein